ncbi:hypothetical protein ZWY2020_007686 [Hordeum vulgare]|nr:hypothetical protein ZWY2020_007686 [Hordeum vulgare]
MYRSAAAAISRSSSMLRQLRLQLGRSTVAHLVSAKEVIFGVGTSMRCVNNLTDVVEVTMGPKSDCSFLIWRYVLPLVSGINVMSDKKVQASSTICTGRSRQELQEPVVGLAGDPCLPWKNSWTGVGCSDASPMHVLSLNRGRVPESPTWGVGDGDRRASASPTTTTSGSRGVAHHHRNHPASEVQQRGGGG